MIVNHLRYFIEIAKTKSFTKAAENLFISQSTISKAVISLEKELQTPLHEPGNHKFVLTESGKLLYDFAVDVIDYYEEKEKILINKINRQNIPLNLGLPPTSGSIYFFSLINEYRKKYTDIELNIFSITSIHMKEKLLAGELDLGIVIEPFEDDRFIKKIAYTSEAVLVVSEKHHLSNKKVVDFSTLSEEKFIQVTSEFQYNGVFVEQCKRAGFKPNIIFENDQWDMLLEMVANNQGVTILPRPLVEKYISKNARFIRLKNPKFPWSLTVIYRKNAILTKSMEKFLDLVK
ncbi:LysR family transcriptional regulator [Peptoniphilus porci]|uniref:HTH lysR-type domain-containing protein n=1 Tax=Peptoniphilus porci TaxID=2652280 RepID=A0A1U7M0B0_9FIRM|nr:LysR family transcriptional regulator [Peptoniphilus porci]OLR65105.1 hypothetical protein BIV18_06055 [Peptoniphilus porci]